MKGCPTSTSAIPPFRLNATSLAPDSFILSLNSTLTHGPFQALLDSGSSHSFVDKLFAQRNKLTLVYLPQPILLQLFDGSSASSVTGKTQLPIIMLTGKTHKVELFITKLDKGYSMVLGYDWLLQHNPTINWVETKVIFKTPLAPPKIKTPPATIKICKVSARNFHKHSQEPGATTYMVSNLGSTPHSSYSINPIHTKSAELDTDSPTFPLEYQEFANAYSGEEVNMLAPHHPYDLQINTKGDAKPFYGPIYSLSQPELMALCKFLDKNTQNGFIRPSSSPWGSLVLFVKKKDGSL